MSKSIYVITPFYYPEINGVSFVVQKNVKALIELGYSPIVLTKCGSKSISSEKVVTFDLKGNGTIANRINGEVDKYLNFISKMSKDSLVICHCWHNSFSNLFLDNTINRRITLYSHGTSFLNSSSLIKNFPRIINYIPEIISFKKRLNKLSVLTSITLNKKNYRCHDLKLFRGKVFFIENPGIDRSFDENAEIQVPYKDYYLIISNFEKIKNQYWLIKNIIKNKISENFVFIGSSKSKYFFKIKKLLRKSRDNNIKLVVGASDSETSFYLKNCKTLLFPGKNDFSPMTLIEAIKYNIPFISFNTVQMHPKCGYYTNNKRDFIGRILNNRETIKTDNSEYYEDVFSFKKYKENIEKLISLLD